MAILLPKPCHPQAQKQDGNLGVALPAEPLRRLGSEIAGEQGEFRAQPEAVAPSAPPVGKHHDHPQDKEWKRQQGAPEIAGRKAAAFQTTELGRDPPSSGTRSHRASAAAAMTATSRPRARGSPARSPGAESQPKTPRSINPCKTGPSKSGVHLPPLRRRQPAPVRHQCHDHEQRWPERQHGVADHAPVKIRGHSVTRSMSPKAPAALRKFCRAMVDVAAARPNAGLAGDAWRVCRPLRRAQAWRDFRFTGCNAAVQK